MPRNKQPVRSWLIAALVTVAVLAIVFLLSANFYTDWLWFKSVGYTAVFRRIIWSQVLWTLLSGAAIAAFVFPNLRAARLNPPTPTGEVEDARFPIFIQPRNAFRVLAVAAGVLTIIAALYGGSQWTVIEQFIHRTSFGQTDPLFSRDIGFFVFSLPFWQLISSLGGFTILLTTALVAALYLLGGAIQVGDRMFTLLPRVRTHLSLLGAGLFLAKAGEYWLRLYQLVYSPRGAAFGASYTDVHALLPALRVLLLIALFCAALLLVNIFKRSLKLFAVSFGLLLASSVLLGSVYPNFVQRFQVEPNEIVKETPYIDRNITLTRAAYALDGVEESDFPVEYNLNPEILQANQDTISNIRLWDWQPLLQTYGQLQEIRPYYRFSDVDLDRYPIDGQVRMVMLSARELDQAKLPVQAKTWVNQYLKYTHGYGITVSPANATTAEGLPQFLVKDVPPQTTPGLAIDRPQIYFGELNYSQAIVNTRELEFDYPAGEQNAYNQYDGKGGIRLSSFLVKAAFAYRLRSYNLLLTSAVTHDSRILLYRNINQIARRIAPMLKYDSDPYIVASGGRLYWMIDAYTATSMYPYSEPFTGAQTKSAPHLAGYNYIRNAVKITIDAYDGDVRLYAADPADPLLQTYQSIFPGVFLPLGEMPEDLRQHIRYPADLFNVQAAMFRAFHMKDTVVFYNKEDYWDLPNEKYADETIPMEPFYNLMRLPTENETEFILMLPFTPSQKKNMIAWLAARSDPANYGKLVLYRMPKQVLVYGPEQIEASIDQDAEISQSLTLWGQKGSQVIRGNLLTIPVNHSLLYVEPLYLQSTETKLPQLIRVIVAYGNEVVMEPTLSAALERIFGAEPGSPPPTNPDTPAPPAGTGTLTELAAQATALYNRAQERSQAGDWAGYGEAIRELGEVLREIALRTGS